MLLGLVFVLLLLTSDIKLVKITVSKVPSVWKVKVFTLSTRVWKTVNAGVPFKSLFFRFEVFVDGVIYFSAIDGLYSGVGSNLVISFDLKSEKFGEVCLPERLVHALLLGVVKVNESLGLLEDYVEGGMMLIGVWTRKDGASKTFTQIYTIKVEDSVYHVLGFRNNGEVLMEMMEESELKVYEPFSGHTNGAGINGEQHTFTVCSYMETLLLLNESDSIIH